ncbi:amidohydrolase [Paenarthrobacter aurescens]|jgi:predicted amidohydrolase YtcJ|uniref:Amidohydrolase family protein n=1 Tax=Paenarthrobacter aurescens (strain TC1) TaxID=290340 RepID=A1RDD6_PAEAT|nr:amidohydrolase [Paenarthrobacter aurescens]ABM10676.1 putative amidohydrolase family protein [Paenarthrobacter aurescens TC1]
MSEQNPPELIVMGARIFTSNPANEWAEALAIAGGKIVAIGSNSLVHALAGEGTEVLELHGELVLPGFSDGHSHLGLGGGQTAWELPILPTDPKSVIFDKIRRWSADLGPDEWIIGGIVGATVMDEIMNTDDLASLDAAAGGRPVLLRDDSMHNRWVNSRALELMNVGADTPDPEGGTYVRDESGALTGVLQELASAVAEAAADAAVADPDSRNRVSLKTALETLNSFGITSVQDAATMEYSWKALSALEADNEVTAWVVGSMPARNFIEAGVVGHELFDIADSHRSTHVRPDFVKFVVDGIPMTRTSAMLMPYICHHNGDQEFRGAPLWTQDELVESLELCYQRGYGGKLHATGDASVKLVLDAVEKVRRRHGFGPIFQIAHVEFIDPEDIPRFAELQVVPDASPYIWYPSVIQDSIAKQIPVETVRNSWPVKDLLEAGALLAAGSDWPCALPSPDPWIGLETLVTRRNPDPAVEGVLNESQRLTVAEAIAAFTCNPAAAMGLADVTGMLREGLSADFIVVDRNLFEVEPASIHQTRVLETYFEGRKVYDRSATSLREDAVQPPRTALAG